MFRLVINNGMEMEEILKTEDESVALNEKETLKVKFSNILKCFYEVCEKVEPKSFDDLEEDAMSSFINLAHPYYQLTSDDSQKNVMKEMKKKFSEADISLSLRAYLKDLSVVKIVKI